jgi:zona occludens toxin
MITLRTGLPGACKTLSTLRDLYNLQKKWEKNPGETRPVYCHNIAGLTLPHEPLPLKDYQPRNGVKIQVPDWDSVAEGAFIILDECQCFFPPRSSQTEAPPHVSFMNTHRHRGFDIELITQHPKLIDVGIRRLVGKHLHFRRLFGRQKSIVYEFTESNDALVNFSNGVTSFFNFPKNIFEFYKSAEVHTKQSFKLPKWLIIPFIGLAMGAYFIPSAYSVLSGGMTGKGIKKETSEVTGKITLVPAPSIPVAPAKMPVVAPPLVPDVPKTPFNSQPVFASACLATATRCRCYGLGGARVSINDALCREAASSNIDMGKQKWAAL